jgi:hypothetical protein
VVFTAANRKKMAGAKSEKEKRLNYTIQPFARQFFGAILNVQLLAAKGLATNFLYKNFVKT